MTFLDHKAVTVPVTIDDWRALDQELRNKDSTYLRDVQFISQQYLLVNYRSCIGLLDWYSCVDNHVKSFHKAFSDNCKIIYEASIVKTSVANDGNLIALLTLERKLVVFA